MIGFEHNEGSACKVSRGAACYPFSSLSGLS